LFVVALATAATAIVTPALMSASTADAGGVRIRVGGSARVRVGGVVRVGPRVRYRRAYRGHYRPRRVYVWGGFYTYRFASPPPPPAHTDCYDACGGPGYYAQPAPQPTVVATAPARAPLPRFGLGLSAGRFESESGRDADELGLFARFRLSDAVELELATSKTEHDDATRLDKRFGGALYLDFAPHSDWAPFVLGGAGWSTTEYNGGELSHDGTYAEVGAGLRWRLTDAFTLAGDVRLGKNMIADDEEVLQLARPEMPTNADEKYSSARVLGILYF
jgi:hypothetical protein